MFKKADIVLFFIILILGTAVTVWTLAGSRAGQVAVVTVGGKVYGTYDLSDDREIDVVQGGHHNHITIKGGAVSMTFSDCKNQVCVHTGRISETKETIVCLPNRVMVEIRDEAGVATGDERSDVDVITG